MGLEEDLDVYIYPVYKSKTLKGSSKRYIPDSFVIESANGKLKPRTLDDPYFVYILTGFKPIVDLVCLAYERDPNDHNAVKINVLSHQAMRHYFTHAAFAINQVLTESGYIDRLKQIYPPERVDEELEKRIPLNVSFPPDADAETCRRIDEEAFAALFRLVGGRQKQATPLKISDITPEE